MTMVDGAVPIDHGWAWMCTLGCAISTFFCIGAFKCTGILFVEFLTKFQTSTHMTSFLFGLSAAGMSLLAPVASYLSDRFGVRIVVMSGALFSSLAPLICAFAPNIYFVVIVFGLLTGAGIAFMFGPSITILGMYFRKRRSVANGMGMAGGSIGQLVMPVLLNHWIKEYGLTGTLILYAGLLLHGIVGGALMRPLSFYSHHRKRPKADAKSDIKPAVRMPSLPQSPIQRAVSEGLLTAKLPNGKLHERAFSESHIVKQNSTQSPSVESLYIIEQAISTPEGNVSDSNVSCWLLFCQPLFILYVVAVCMGNVGYVNTILFLPVLLRDLGMGVDHVATLLATVGVCDLFARLAGGWIADRRCVRRSVYAAFCLLMLSIVTTILATLPSFNTAVVFAICVGIFGGMYASFFAIVLVDFLGMSVFSQAFGLTIMFMGFTNMFLPVTIGKLRDVSGSLRVGYYVCATMLLASAFSYSIETCVRHIQRIRHTQKLDKQFSENHLHQNHVAADAHSMQSIATK